MRSSSKLCNIVTSAALILVPVLSFAGNGMYLSVQGGAAFPTKKLNSIDSILNSSNVIHSKEKLKTSAVVGVIAGKDIYKNMAVELEFVQAFNHKSSRTSTESDNNAIPDSWVIHRKAKVSSSSVFLNGTYKQNINKFPVVPYITAGVGYSSNKTSKVSDTYIDPALNSTFVENTTKGRRTGAFAWQAGIGALIPVTNNIELDFSGKYRDFGKVKTAKTVTQFQPSLGTSSTLDKGKSIISSRLRTIHVLAGVRVNF